MDKPTFIFSAIFIAFLWLGTLTTWLIIHFYKRKKELSAIYEKITSIYELLQQFSPTFINEAIHQLLNKSNSIILKLNTMGENLNAANEALDAMDAKLTKIAADVAALHALSDGIEIPTQAEWDALKGKIAALNNKAQGIDDATPE